ncbi:MAG: glycoside hydrolase family 20 zincin-like fold domain-containing protein [Verrucomicrobiota bacterium]
MAAENNYDFRKKMRQIHRAGRRDMTLTPHPDECVIDELWVIAVPENFGADQVLATAARDFQDYLAVSMGISIPIRTKANGINEIRLELDQKSKSGNKSAAFSLIIAEKSISITGESGRGVFAGTIYLEDQLNLREAPFLASNKIHCDPLIKARGVHSGFGLDLFPDHELAAIAHAGFNEIYLFIREPGRCANASCDIQDVIDRAGRYGLDVMFYSYIPGYMHPDDPAAAEYFDHNFGAVFKAYPQAKGITLVGESAQFPSRDPATTGKRWNESFQDGIPDQRPSPGWWPCQDYPDWIQAVEQSIRKYKPDAKIAFSTYNWLWAPVAARRKFLEALSKTVQVRIPFEIFKIHDLGNGVRRQVMDYTISETDFSPNCREELEMAHQVGLNIGVTALTCGTPWNFGTAPYVPVPLQWIKKFRTLQQARKKYGADDFYDSHHMGWWPSIITDLGRAAFRQPETDLDALLRRLTVRDYGIAAADTVMQVWRLWSEALENYVASNENQYGPFRVGPSYPLVFHPNVTRTMTGKEIQFPTMKHAYANSAWLKTLFQPFENSDQSPYALRHRAESVALDKMLALWQAGVRQLADAERLVPVGKVDRFTELLLLGRFIECFIITGIHVNRWYRLNLQLLNADTPSAAFGLLDELEQVARAEIHNAENAIPVVEADSRLGWEPSMEYMTDRWHLEWKIRQVRSMLDNDLAMYRKILPNSRPS